MNDGRLRDGRLDLVVTRDQRDGRGCCWTTRAGQHGTPNRVLRASAVRDFDWRNRPLKTAVTASSLGPEV